MNKRVGGHQEVISNCSKRKYGSILPAGRYVIGQDVQSPYQAMAQVVARQMLLRFLTAGSPILLHPLRNFPAFLGAHELPATTLDAVSGSRSSTGTSLQFLQRSDYPLKSRFLAT